MPLFHGTFPGKNFLVFRKNSFWQKISRSPDFSIHAQSSFPGIISPVASALSSTITVTGSFRTCTGFPFHRIHIRTYFLRLDCRPYEHLILYSHFLHILSMKPTFYFVISYQDYSAIPLRFHLIFTLISLHFRHSEKFENKNIPIPLQEHGDIPF